MNRISELFRGGSIAFLILVTLFLTSCSGGTEPSAHLVSGQKKILVFSATKGYRHSSIKEGINALTKLGRENAFAVEATEDPKIFSEERLKGFKAVVFLNTTGSFFNDSQKQAFQKYIQNGGGFLGVHSAADSFYDWPWYGALVGGYFESHPEIQTATLHVQDSEHPSTTALPRQWQKRDEWYNFKSLSNKTKVILTVDESTYRGGKNGKNHPISWYQEFEGGRAFYTGLGHTEDSYTDENFLKHILGALKWVMREN